MCVEQTIASVIETVYSEECPSGGSQTPFLHFHASNIEDLPANNVVCIIKNLMEDFQVMFKLLLSI